MQVQGIRTGATRMAATSAGGESDSRARASERPRESFDWPLIAGLTGIGGGLGAVYGITEHAYQFGWRSLMSRGGPGTIGICALAGAGMLGFGSLVLGVQLGLFRR